MGTGVPRAALGHISPVAVPWSVFADGCTDCVVRRMRSRVQPSHSNTLSMSSSSSSKSSSTSVAAHGGLDISDAPGAELPLALYPCELYEYPDRLDAMRLRPSPRPGPKPCFRTAFPEAEPDPCSPSLRGRFVSASSIPLPHRYCSMAGPMSPRPACRQRSKRACRHSGNRTPVYANDRDPEPGLLNGSRNVLFKSVDVELGTAPAGELGEDASGVVWWEIGEGCGVFMPVGAISALGRNVVCVCGGASRWRMRTMLS